MIDWFVLLAPLLILPVVLLFIFVGCCFDTSTGGGGKDINLSLTVDDSLSVHPESDISDISYESGDDGQRNLVADAPDSNTKLLFHAEGDDEGSTFVDDGATGHTLTQNGGAVTDTAQKYFGSTSLHCTADYIYAADHADWDFGSGEFTLEARIRFASTPTTDPVLSHYDHTTNNRAWSLKVIGSTSIRFSYSTAGTVAVNVDSDAVTINNDTWYHVAVVRDGNTLRFFLDGVAKGTGDLSGVTLYSANAEMRIGSASDGSVGDGWIDEARISKGVARWTSGFTPPTAPYNTTVLQVSQSFTPAATTTIQSVDLYCLKTSSPDGDVTVGLYADSGGQPTGSALTEVSIAASTLGGSAGWTSWNFGDYAVTGSTKYHIVMSRTGSPTGGAVVWREDTGGGYSGGNSSTSADGGSSWTPQSGDMLFKLFHTAIIAGKFHWIIEGRAEEEHSLTIEKDERQYKHGFDVRDEDVGKEMEAWCTVSYWNGTNGLIDAESDMRCRFTIEKHSKDCGGTYISHAVGYEAILESDEVKVNETSCPI